MSSSPENPVSSRLTVLSTGNEELDTRLGGGLPYPSLIVIEGDNGTGKTVLCTQFAYGILESGRRVQYITTENSVRGLLEQSRNISLDLTDYFLKGFLAITPAHMENIRWNKVLVKLVADAIVNFIKYRSRKYDVFIIDSLSILASYLTKEILHRLLSEFKSIVKKGKMIIITLHSSIIREDVMKEFAATADVYLKLSLAEVGGRSVKAMSIVKIRGAPSIAETLIAFDVDPAFGIKIVPVALAKA